MNLYQWQFTHQPHYVVAESLGDAEKTIKDKYGWTTDINRIDNLGPYVEVSPVCCPCRNCTDVKDDGDTNA
jgi:hypothetical protein